MNEQQDGGELRTLIDTRGTVQKQRIAYENRLLAIKQGRDGADEPTTERYKEWADVYQALENKTDKEIADICKEIDIVYEMSVVKGVNYITAAKVASMIDITRCDTVSALWRYCGYGVVDGKAERMKKGEKLHYNKRLKTACYLVGVGLMRWNTKYSDIYYKTKEYYEKNRPDWTKLHRHRAAFRKMVKVWIAHLWLQWRTLEGLSTRPLYVHEKMNHTHYHDGRDFGWPEQTVE